ncbi:hypothetical protein [Microbulbifer mangrovi]|uniref:hypothetical protein n=1 Tax=Microbulbifer mangrovi TaxID=927787 RepID=UPI0009904BB1|nr:hypothetical protein [Microbulbifer mangrovi]
MNIIKTFRPGDDGTKKYSDKYGQQLCAVRYRRSRCKKTVYTTVEIIVAEREAYPRSQAHRAANTKLTEWVALKIAFDELELRNEVKRIGGRWSKLAKAWVVKRKLAEGAELHHRIVEGLIDKCLDVGM